MEHTTDTEAVEVDVLDWDEHLDDRDRFDQWTDADDDPIDLTRTGADR